MSPELRLVWGGGRGHLAPFHFMALRPGGLGTPRRSGDSRGTFMWTALSRIHDCDAPAS